MCISTDHFIGFDEVVDVEEVGPPVVLAVVSVRIAGRPEGPLAPVWVQTHVHHNHQHVGWRQSGPGTTTTTTTTK